VLEWLTDKQWLCYRKPSALQYLGSFQRRLVLWLSQCRWWCSSVPNSEPAEGLAGGWSTASRLLHDPV